ncbi:hypothetical protein QQX98_004351 [Neonectria punicea]|uniref:Actin-like ATPase domain-containing protein n=1 Tax=Neonectria punicea TaxID=979145 RepID=A0ABR1H9P9_9HYPO
MAAAQPSRPDGDAPTRVFVGIDFGTTFSGLSYIVGNVAGTEPTTLSWSNECRFKFPSKVTSSGGNTLCGVMIPEGEKSMQWFKLAILHRDDLDREIIQSPLYQQYEHLRTELRLRADEVTSHLFRHMWDRFLSKFLPSHRHGAFDYFLTVAVPAGWPRYAINSIRKAVERSDILNDLRVPCRFVAEPEATIVGVFDAPALVLGPGEHRLSHLSLQQGDLIQVPDCGGGTVDLGVYQVSGTEPLVMNESLPAICKLNGALKLDDRFMALLESKVQDVPTHARFNSRKEEYFRNFSENFWFSEMKINFGQNQAVWTYEVPSAWLPAAAKRSHLQLRFTSEEITTVFEPVADIAQLVADQIREIHSKMGKAPKYVLVAGGFGLNHYLRRVVHERVDSVANALGCRIQTLAYEMAFGLPAVSKGAARNCAVRFNPESPLSASAGQVDGHVVTASYGIHDPSQPTPSWFVREGQTMSTRNRPRLNLDPSVFTVTEESDSTAVLELVVYAQQDATPSRPCFNVKWKSGVNVREFSPGSPGIQMEPVFDGFSMSIELFYQNVRQGEDRVAVEYEGDDSDD